jgi:hypothetical protein
MLQIIPQGVFGLSLPGMPSGRDPPESFLFTKQFPESPYSAIINPNAKGNWWFDENDPYGYDAGLR